MNKVKQEFHGVITIKPFPATVQSKAWRVAAQFMGL
jgi:hypothetical protein